MNMIFMSQSESKDFIQHRTAKLTKKKDNTSLNDDDVNDASVTCLMPCLHETHLPEVN